MEMKDELDPQDIEKARTFWAEADVERIFTEVLGYLDHLKKALKKKTATDKEYIQGLKLIASLDCTAVIPAVSAPDLSVFQVVFSSDVLQSSDFSIQPLSSSSSAPCLPPSNELPASAASPAGKEELVPAVVPVQLNYQVHSCSKSCLPGLSSVAQSMSQLYSQNPLKVPLLCGFQRFSAVPMTSPSRGGALDCKEKEDADEWDVLYKAPCGQSLRNHGDVMRFLVSTESCDVLQVDFFTFNSDVRLDQPLPSGSHRPELDLSRGIEPTPVELYSEDDGAQPDDFRYRKDRWPHGCFLTRGPKLFRACCDCTDGCVEAARCACANLTTGGRHYSYHRLSKPVASGVYECGPWCGCVRARCQNRLVQRGIRARLQVFQTDNRGWGVRCRDDLDCGTFVCIYAGVILRRHGSPDEAPPPKLMRADLPSDDEVEVVTEWLAPPVLEGRTKLLETPPPGSSPLHVPVIQRPADSASTLLDRNKIQTVVVGGPESESSSAGGSGDHCQEQEVKVAVATTDSKTADCKKKDIVVRTFKRAAREKDVYFLDASKEGNVGRFINHSCDPNLFVQNVFTDTHDPGFPVVAFFTSRVVKAGTELTWSYSADMRPTSQEELDVPCLCGSDACRGRFTVQEKLCEECEVGGHKGRGPVIGPEA